LATVRRAGSNARSARHCRPSTAYMIARAEIVGRSEKTARRHITLLHRFRNGRRQREGAGSGRHET
jgi:hypothetical protein